TVDPSGGILPFSYLWNTGQSTQTNSGLAAGIYTVTVTDSKGCSNAFTATVSEPDQLLAVITGINDPTCNQSNGTASVGVTGGAGGDEYLWSNGQTTSSVSGLSAGTYTVTVTDDNNCTSEAQVTLQNVGENSTTPVAASICQGSSYTLPDGSLVSAQGVYNTNLISSTGCDSLIVTTLTVNAVITVQVSASICPGDSYMLPDGTLVSDAAVYNTLLVSSGNCDSLVVTTLSLNPVYSNNVDVAICSGSTYTFPDGTVSGVAGTHTSSLLTAAGCDSVIITTLTVNPATGSVTDAQICSGTSYSLPDGQLVSQPGTYTTTLSTSLGCDSVVTTHLSIIVISTPTVTASGPLAFCPGESVVLTSSVAANYQWLKNGVVIPGATAQSYTANKSGNYKVRVSTPCGDVLSGAKVVTKYGVPAVTVSPSGTVSICLYDNLLISASVSGSNPVTYQWYRNNVLIVGATNPTYVATSNGRYKVMVTNSQTGCTTISPVTKVEKQNFTATLTHDLPLISCGPDITFTITTNAGAGSTFQWKRNGVILQGVTGSTLITKAPGTYKVIVTSASGCTRISNAFTVVDCYDNTRTASNYKVFPNPSNGIVQIEKTDGITGDLIVELSDISGRIVQTLNHKSIDVNSRLQFDTSNLPKGIYSLRIIENGQVNSLKVLVE
ncbi:MAG TPA: T9SS type A sorting domain-containing protein, partial [Bacteroidia bacterium]|nr:T9SS type A sorting domain-containing protein [Bacteroidia bacterium]